MMWFTAGAVAGVSGSVYVRRKAKEAADRYRPVSMAKGAVERVADAVREGRAAMVAREAELRAAQDADPLLAAPRQVEPHTARAGDLRFDFPAERARSGPRRRSRR
ncbi:MAG TPA: hypothetical protein VGF22_09195 [Acidimicrobiales bacterium]